MVCRRASSKRDLVRCQLVGSLNANIQRSNFVSQALQRGHRLVVFDQFEILLLEDQILHLLEERRGKLERNNGGRCDEIVTWTPSRSSMYSCN